MESFDDSPLAVDPRKSPVTVCPIEDPEHRQHQPGHGIVRGALPEQDERVILGFRRIAVDVIDRRSAVEVLAASFEALVAHSGDELQELSMALVTLGTVDRTVFGVEIDVFLGSPEIRVERVASQKRSQCSFVFEKFHTLLELVECGHVASLLPVPRGTIATRAYHLCEEPTGAPGSPRATRSGVERTTGFEPATLTLATRKRSTCGALRVGPVAVTPRAIR